MRQSQADHGRKRAGTKKSRTGCRTCRARHIKCDEAPDSCKNCTSTGRSCEYDLQRLPRSSTVSTAKESGPLKLIPREITDGLRWAVTTDERRCYSYFKSQTISTLSGFFDSPLWQEILPQRSVSDPAVYHAVVALSAVHQDLEMHGLPLPGQDLQNAWNRFALDQCGRSFTLLSRRHASQDPYFREVILMCCLLFVITQLLRSQYDEAFRHLQSGLKILDEAKENPREPPVAHCIVEAFTNLEIQSIQLGACEVALENNGFEHQICIFDTPEIFSSFQEARRSLDSILGAVFRFLTRCGGLSEQEILSDYEALHKKQLELLSQCNGFGSRFELFCGSRTFNAKEQRGADMMRLVQRFLALTVKICLLRDETALDYYTSEHETHILMAAEIMTRFPDRPSVTLDIGIIPPLYSAAMWCRDHNVRRRAIAVLKSWPHREGPFESEWTAWVASEQLKAETMSNLEESSRIGASGQHSKAEKGRCAWSGGPVSGLSIKRELTRSTSLPTHHVYLRYMNILLLLT
ncbi:transcriptional regulator family: Fungal Specific TF [Paecilomyces variotii]|nr:transcriptional regulator family: Fungal Specific TF [Paecilomyces variotii]